MTGPGAAETALARATWQVPLLAERPRRMELLRLRPTWATTPRTVRVHRNHGVELVTSVWRPFCAYAGLDVVPVLGPYDDTLAMAGAEEPTDLHVVSLDFERYRARTTGPELLDWLVGRLRELTRRSSAPVLVTDWPAPDAAGFDADLRRAVADLPGVVVADLAGLARDLGSEFVDLRRSADTGTPWSAVAAVEVARAFGLRWLPALLGPPVKAVVVDLDGTLYDGVLGEDGPAGVRLTAGHRALQEHLVDLRRAGVYLAVVSRNEPADVEELFRRRADFPLTLDQVSAVSIGWGSKGEGVGDVAAQLRIGTDAVALLDDNPGELATVASAHPGVRTLHAADAGTSLRALVHCPGLFRFRTTEDDARRVSDLAVATRRAARLATAEDPDDYLRSLQVELRCRADRPADVPRLADLSARTNQFTTALLRLTPGELTARSRRGAPAVVAVTLRDRLADSGTVAAVFGHREGRQVVVDGISISCRALGRRVETAVVEAAVGLLAGPDTDEVAFRYATGPRNAPALAWLADYTGTALGNEGTVVVGWDRHRVAADAAARPVTIIVEEQHDDG